MAGSPFDRGRSHCSHRTKQSARTCFSWGSGGPKDSIGGGPRATSVQYAQYTYIYIYLTLFDSATIVQASLAISTPGHPRPRISGHQSLVHQKKIAICHLSLVGWLITFQQQNSTYPRLGDFFFTEDQSANSLETLG